MLCVQRCSFECLGCNKQLLSDCCLFWLIILVHALKPRESCAAKIPVDEMFLIDQPVWHQQPSSVQSYLTHLDARFQLQQVSSTMATCLNAKWCRVVGRWECLSGDYACRMHLAWDRVSHKSESFAFTLLLCLWFLGPAQWFSFSSRVSHVGKLTLLYRVMYEVTKHQHGDGKVMADGTIMSCVLVVKNYVKHYFMSVG